MQRLLQAALVFVCVCIVGMATAWAVDLKPVPKLVQPVMDTANVMTPTGRDALNQKLLEYSRGKGSQIVVLTVDTTAPEDIFTYSMRAARAWELGRAKEDDGILLVVAKDDRQNQILVGNGLEGVVTDLDAHRILKEVVAPHFRNGDFDGGINAAVDKLQGLIAGEALPAPDTNEGEGEGGGSWLVLLLPVLFLASFLKRIFGSFLGSVIAAVITAGACLFFGTGFLVAIASAVGVMVFSLILGAGAMVFPSGGGGHWGGGGGFGGGSSGGGGGFSGGGGGFSGGGSSGGW